MLCGKVGEAVLADRYATVLREKKMQSKCFLNVVDDDIESPYKIAPDIFDFFLYRDANGKS